MDSSVTVLLQQVAAGDKTALDQLIPVVYSEMKRLADSMLRRERSAHTLQPTALVHEAYAKLLGKNQPVYEDRAHFLAVASRVMRQILIDYSRTHRAAKRGGGAPNLSLEEIVVPPFERPVMMMALADALDTLERQDPRKVRLIEQRYFGGLTLEESATVSGMTIDAVRYELRIAQAWLHRELARGEARPAG